MSKVYEELLRAVIRPSVRPRAPREDSGPAGDPSQGTTRLVNLAWLPSFAFKFKARANGNLGPEDATRRGSADDRGGLVALTRQEELKLVQRLFLVPGAGTRRAVLFAGVERENGCAGICARAGEVLATQEPRSVCVVDGNLRAPSLHGYFGGDNGDGLAGVVERSDFALTSAQQMSPDNLWLLSAGSSASDPDLLLTPDRVRPQMQHLCTLFDRVLINAPPINLYAESLALSQLVDGVVLVVQAHTTRRETVRDVKSSLEAVNVPLLGIVLNDRTFPIPEPLYRLL